MIERNAIDGSCGYGLQRQIEGLGHRCEVVAPSLIPTRPGDRVKTDRRDALCLAKLHRAGELTPVRIPTEAEERIRDVVRCRETFQREILKSRHYILEFLPGAGSSIATAPIGAPPTCGGSST